MLDLVGSSVNAKYLRGIGLIAQESGSLGNATREYYLFNGHGDVTGLTNTSGAFTQRYDYDAFGNALEVNGFPSDGNRNPFRYCGEYFDTETGTIYLRARYYDPATGRFTREDPIRDGLNWYAYTNGNPVKYHDPSGNAADVVEHDYITNINKIIAEEILTAEETKLAFQILNDLYSAVKLVNGK